MANLPILPLKTDALLADTAHLSAEEFGAYCRLLFTMWRHDARLPDDHTEFARIAGVSPRRWKSIAARVLRPFTFAGGLVSQKRLTSTFQDVQTLRRKRAEAANIRWLGGKFHANGMQVQSRSNANQNQISKSLSKGLGEIEEENFE